MVSGLRYQIAVNGKPSSLFFWNRETLNKSGGDLFDDITRTRGELPIFDASRPFTRETTVYYL